jgi:FKBP-type peptidyl-prolyl cis-trans isomerase
MKKSIVAKSLVLATVGLSLVACNQKAAPAATNKAELADFNEKTSYAIGLDVARNLEAMKKDPKVSLSLKSVYQGIADASNGGDVSYDVGYSIGGGLKNMMKGDSSLKLDLGIVFQAIKNKLDGEKVLMDEAAIKTVQQEFQKKAQARQKEAMALKAAEDKKKGEANVAVGKAFLEANKSKEGVVVTASGLQYKVIKAGEGVAPVKEAKVKVHYTGKLLDGTKFDSSVDRGQPTEFFLNRVIPGWTEGLQLMKPGAKFEFWIPSALAYGERGMGGKIAPNSTLNFEVELIEILKTEVKTEAKK